MFSHLKQSLTIETDYDFSNRIVFSELYKAVSTIKQQIMVDGRGNVSHVISDGLKKDTLRKRKVYMDKFKLYVTENSDETYKATITNRRKLENLIVSFLETIRITVKGTNEQIRPKVGYFDTVFSHLKNGLKEETGYDFSNKAVFAKLYNDVSRIKSQIEREGRGDVSKIKRQINPNPWHGNIRCTEIPQDTLQAIFELLSDVQALMKSRLEQNQIQYETDLCKIPENYR